MAFVVYVCICSFNFTNIMYIQFNYISALYRLRQEQTAVPGEVYQVCGRNHSRCIPAVPLFHEPQPVGSTRNSKYSCPSALIHLWVNNRPKSEWSIVLKTEQTKMEEKISQAFEHLRSTVRPSLAAPLEKKRPEAAWRDGWVPPYKHPERSTGCRRWDQC